MLKSNKTIKVSITSTFFHFLDGNIYLLNFRVANNNAKMRMIAQNKTYNSLFWGFIEHVRRNCIFMYIII